VAETKRILVVDDEPKIVEVLERYLVDEGFTVSRAHDGISAVESFKATQPDLVILDLKLPGISGLDAFHIIRAAADIPIIMLTSRTEEVDRILGLELGADDYISKPFSPREVVARVKTVLRRVAQAEQTGHDDGVLSANAAQGQGQAHDEPPGVLVVGGLEIDRGDHEVRVDGRDISLTPTEFRILEVLAQHPGRNSSTAVGDSEGRPW